MTSEPSAPASEQLGTRKAEGVVAFLLAMRDKGIRDARLLRSFELIPRHRFVSSRFADLAGQDTALPIACGQTIGPPSHLAQMLAALSIAPEQTVLEVGTGTGFSTAVLSQLAAQVISVERFKSLCIEARLRLRGFHITNTTVIHTDGTEGVSDFAPFDRILVDASFEAPPLALLGQLVPDGRMVGIRRIGAECRLAAYHMHPERGVIETLGEKIALPPLQSGVSLAL